MTEIVLRISSEQKTTGISSCTNYLFKTVTVFGICWEQGTPGITQTLVSSEC